MTRRLKLTSKKTIHVGYEVVFFLVPGKDGRPAISFVQPFFDKVPENAVIVARGKALDETIDHKGAIRLENGKELDYTYGVPEGRVIKINFRMRFHGAFPVF